VAKNPFNALVNGKMTLVALGQVIKKMEDEANGKAEIKNVVDQRRWANKVHASPILLDMERRVNVSGHGLHIVQGISSRLQWYTCERAPGAPPPTPDVDPSGICLRGCAPGCARAATAAGAASAAASAAAAPAQDAEYCHSCQPLPHDFYYVKYISSAADSSSSRTGVIESSELACLDIGWDGAGGLEDLATRHITSASSCTCQMIDHLGLPCAHILRVWLQLNLSRVPDGVVALRWSQRRDMEEESRARTGQMQEDARRHLQEERRRQQQPAGGAARVLSEGEMYLALMSKAKVLAAAAVSSSARYAAVDKLLSAGLRDAADGVLGLPAAQSRRMRDALHPQARVDESAQQQRAQPPRGAEEGKGEGEEEDVDEVVEAVLDAVGIIPGAPKHVVARKRKTGPGVRQSANKGKRHCPGKADSTALPLPSSDRAGKGGKGGVAKAGAV
jgi:hypothetical protein